jgi:hypothetical protein
MPKPCIIARHNIMPLKSPLHAPERVLQDTNFVSGQHQDVSGDD